MKTSTGLTLVAWSVGLALMGGASSALWGSDRAPERTPLKLQTDTRPINRDAAERVSYAAVVKKTAASVVYVYSTKKVRGQSSIPFFDFPDGGSRGRNRRAPEQTQHGLGSGIVITADGYILTNNHVVDGADDVKVAIGESSKRYEAKVVGRDALADIAVLKIAATDLAPATLGDSEQLQVGDVVLAIGDPFGLGQSVSRGIVSALGRGPGIEQLEDFIQTDAAINPGNSGGALIDTDGRVVGINTAILSGSGSFNGIGFAIPVNLVRSITEQLVDHGHVSRAFLGVKTQSLEADLSSVLKTDHGALITEVQDDTPAAKAGLKDGDIITKVNQTAIKDPRHLQLTVTQLAPGSDADVEYVRDGKTATLKVKLAQRSDDKLAAGDHDGAKDEGVLNGVGVGDLTPEIREQLDLPRRIAGAVITEVDPDSASARAGLRENDVISELDHQPVHNAEEAVKLSDEIKGPKVLVRLWRDGQSRYLVVDESK